MRWKKALSAALAIMLMAGMALPCAAEVNKSTNPLVDPQALVPGRSADDVVNILLLGSEKSTGGQRGASAARSKVSKAQEIGVSSIMMYHTDAVMVLSINKTQGKINLISIPRDTMVYVPGVYGVYKMNNAFNCASSVKEGISRSRDTVRWLLGGLKIDAYVFVDMGALLKLCNALGGVDFVVEQAFTGTSGRKYSAGKQHLDGQGIIDYVRARKSIDSDDQKRTGRARKMISAIIEKLWGDWELVNKLWKTANGKGVCFYTNIEGSQLSALYKTTQGLGKLEIGSYVLEGEYGTQTTCGDFQFRVLDQDNRIRVLKEAFGIDAEPLPYISVRYLRWLNADHRGIDASEANSIRFSNDGFCLVKRLHHGQLVMAYARSLGKLTESQQKALKDFEKVYNEYLAAFEEIANKVNSGKKTDSAIPVSINGRYSTKLGNLADAVGYKKGRPSDHGHFWEQDFAINQYYQIDWR